MNDKRNSARRDTVLYLRITHARSGKIIGRLADVSTTGLLVITEEPLSVGSTIAACINLPTRLTADQEKLCGSLTPRWSKPDRNPRLTLNGCLFAVSSDDTELLESLIEEYGFNNGTIDFRRRYERSKDALDEENR